MFIFMYQINGRTFRIVLPKHCKCVHELHRDRWEDLHLMTISLPELSIICKFFFRDELREHLKNAPKMIMTQNQEVESSDSSSSSSSSSSSDDSSSSDSSSESDSDSSSSSGSSGTKQETAVVVSTCHPYR